MDVRRLLVLLLVVLGALTCLSSGASALPYEAAVTASQLSPTLWEYTLYNTSTSDDYVLFDVSLYDITVTSIVVPDGWEADWAGKDGNGWFNSGEGPTAIMNAASMDACVAAGNMRSGFTSEYSCPLTHEYVAATRWSALRLYQDGRPGGGSTGGKVAVVPEAPGWLGLALPLLGLSLIVYKKRITGSVVLACVLAFAVSLVLADDMVGSEPGEVIAATVRVQGNWAVGRWYTVDVTGVMATLPGGTRTISANQILVGTDSRGRPCTFPLVWRNSAGQLVYEWPYKVAASLISM